MPVKKVADPLRSAAILRVSFELAGNADHPQFRAIYDGILRDYQLEHAAVLAYIAKHRPELEVAARGRKDGDASS